MEGEARDTFLCGDGSDSENPIRQTGIDRGRGAGMYRGRDVERFTDEDEIADGGRNSSGQGGGGSREREELPDSPQNTKRTRRVLRSLDLRSIDQDVPVRLSSSRLAAHLSDRFLDQRSRFLDLS